jgi:hypothetical protein
LAHHRDGTNGNAESACLWAVTALLRPSYRCRYDLEEYLEKRREEEGVGRREEDGGRREEEGGGRR